jgi:hypothetical protein
LTLHQLFLTLSQRLNLSCSQTQNPRLLLSQSQNLLLSLLKSSQNLLRIHLAIPIHLRRMRLPIPLRRILKLFLLKSRLLLQQTSQSLCLKNHYPKTSNLFLRIPKSPLQVSH